MPSEKKTHKKPSLNQIRVAKRVIEQVKKGEKVSITKAMRGIYSPATAKHPEKITNSKSWEDLMEEHLSDAKLTEAHDSLLTANHMDHMIFPLGPEDEEEKAAMVDMEDESMPHELQDRTTLTDKDISEMLFEIGCVVRKIVHGNTARHVYFWAPDNKSRISALDMGYKLRGKYAPIKTDNRHAVVGIMKHMYVNAKIDAKRGSKKI